MKLQQLTKPLVLLLGLSASATALAAHLGGDEQRVTIEENTDYPGNDYRTLEFGTANSKPAPALSGSCGQTILGGSTSYNEYRCARECLEDDKCKAWTFKKKKVGKGGTCFLKDAVSSRKSTPASGWNNRTAGVKQATPHEVQACIAELNAPPPEKAPEDYVIMTGHVGLGVDPGVKVDKVTTTATPIDCMMACYLDGQCRTYSFEKLDDITQCKLYFHNVKDSIHTSTATTSGWKSGPNPGKTHYTNVKQHKATKVNANTSSGVSIGVDNTAYCAGICLAPGIVNGKNCLAYHVDETQKTCHLFATKDVIKAPGFTAGVVK